MEIFYSLKSGMYRTFKARKGVLIVWVFSLILVSLPVFPLRSALNSALDRSMITENLAGGFNIEVFADLGAVLKSIVSLTGTRIFIIILVGIPLNAFLTGGLFSSLKKEPDSFSTLEFFRSGAANFWSFLFITLIMTGLIVILSAVFGGAAVAVVNSLENVTEKSAFLIGLSGIIVFLVMLPVLLLVSDYARARKAAYSDSSSFRAIGFGFSRTFRNFRSSYSLMLLVVFIQLLFVWGVFNIIPYLRPATGGGVFLLFVLSQFFFYIRIFLKTLRYGSVTSLMEQVSHEKYPKSELSDNHQV